MDEMGFRIGMGKNQWIVTKTPEQQSCFASSNNREFLTVVECISGDKSFLPPMVIIPGVMQMEA